jgi:transglutaminase/protease-like cytokinesis protein 3
VGPAYFSNDLKLVGYHTGLTRLENFEVAELTLSVPHGLDIVVETLAGNVTNLGLDYERATKIPGLAQPFWLDNRRYFRIKALLPEGFSQGVVQVFAGEKGILQLATLSNGTKNVLMPAFSVGITHKGQNPQYQFITRHPTPQCKRQDLYVKQPQCKKLIGGNTFLFSVHQHPSGGITSGSGFARTKLAIQSPSGKITKLHRKDTTSNTAATSGVWEATVKCMEVGNWRGLVLADRGNAWSVFAEWYCV